MFPERFRTENLTFRRLTPDALAEYGLTMADIHRLKSEGQSSFLSPMAWNSASTLKETEEYLDHARNAWEERKAAHYLLLRGDGEGEAEFAGLGILHCDWEKKYANPHVVLFESLEDTGLGNEAGHRLIELAFAHLDLDYVVEWLPTDVTGKVKVETDQFFRNMGGMVEGEFRHLKDKNGTAIDVRRYSLSREEYARNADGER